MSKISTYEVAPIPKLADKLIGTSVGGEIEDVTYNFTLSELLDLFIPNIPANTLQGVLDYGNTATQDIILNGTIFTTYLEVTDTATILDSFLTGDTHITGGLYDRLNSKGTAGQVLRSTGTQIEWYTVPTIIPTLQQVLASGNTADISIVLSSNIQALTATANNVVSNTSLSVNGVLRDKDALAGTAGQVLSSTGTKVQWVPLPVYSATSPLLFNSATGVFSIQQANGGQNGFLSSSDWTTFNGKQNAGNYITALTGEVTASGPNSATATVSNAAVIGKVLTGFNPTAGTINASDSILTAFGKTQSQINALVGGVQYQGVWNASTNTPTLTSSVGVQGHYYVVNVAGNTNLNGITDWQIGDWAIFSESVWQKVDNTESVSSVNGFTGAVSLTTDNIPEGVTNQYFTDARARAAISLTTTGTSGASTYNNTTGVLNIPQYQNALTNPVTGTGTTNTLPKFTGASTIGNSNISDSGSLIILNSDTRISNGSLGIGVTPSGNTSIRIAKNITGSATTVGVYQLGQIQSDVTGVFYGFWNNANTIASAFTLTNLTHFYANQGTFGAGSVVTNQTAFLADATLIGATTNYGFRGLIPSGTNRWNLYMDGTAANYLAGDTAIGTASLGTATQLTVGGTETAVSAISRGQLINTTLVASANSDVLVGLDINPTFTNGAFTGVSQYGLRIVPRGNAQLALGATNQAGSIQFARGSDGAFQGSIGYSSGATGADFVIRSGGGSGTLGFDNNAGRVAQFFSTGNFLIQQAGIYADAGFRLDVNGVTRITGTSSTDAPPLGSELLTASNWTSTGWTGDFTVGFTHTTGNTSVLSNTLAAVIGTYYKIQITRSGGTAGSITIGFGGQTRSVSFTRSFEPLATTTGNLTITPTSDFDGTILISVKTIGLASPSVTISPSTGTGQITMRATNVSGNTVIGLNAGQRLSSSNVGDDGANNTFIGVNAGRNSTQVRYNTFIGNSAGEFTVTGTDNTAVGYRAFAANTVGLENTAIGKQAGENSTGSSNLFLGAFAGQNILQGQQNVFVGHSAGRFITGGSTANTISSNSIFIGTNTRAAADNQTNQIVIGHLTTGLGNNTTVIGTASTVTTALYGDLLLGTTTPSTATMLTVSGTETASSAIARGGLINTTLVASANGDNLVALDINSTPSVGAFTGVQYSALRVNGNVLLNANSINIVVSPNGTGTTNESLQFNAGRAIFGYDATIGGAYVGTYAARPISFLLGTSTMGRFFATTGNFTIQNGGTFTDAGFRLDVNGTTRFIGTASSDTAPLGAELAAVTGTGTNWTLAGTNLNVGGYTHTVGSVDPLTTALAAVNGTYYQIAYTITGRTTGSITINYGGTSTSGITATGNTGPLASSTAVLTITPTTDFNGTVVLSIKTIGTSVASSTFASSAGVIATEIRASDISSNLFFGRNNGRRNTTGTNNTFIGSQAGINNTTGSNNTFIGQNSGQINTIAFDNTFIGTNTGANNTASLNTFLGTNAGAFNTTGIANTFVGRAAGQNNTTGSSNVMFGQNAGRFITGGVTANTISNNSIFIGDGTRAAADGQNNQIVIGAGTTGLGSGTTIIGNTNTTLTALYGSVIANGTSINASAVLQADSTTKGFLPPRMTTTEKNAIASPATGLVVFDTTLNGIGVYDSTAWRQLATTTQLNTYLPLAGGTLTGALGGTSATFSAAGQSLQLTSASDVYLNVTRGSSILNIGNDATSAFYVTNTSHRFYVNSGTINALTIASTGAASFSGSGNRPVTIDSNVNIKADGGGWAMQHGFIGSSNTNRGGFGAYGTADTLNYYYIGLFGAEKMIITNSGNVLVGTTTDNGSKLQVEGSVTATTFTATDIESGVYANYFGPYSGGSSSILNFLYGSSGSVTWNNGGVKMTLSSSGTLRITTLAGTGSRAVLADSSGDLSAPVSDISVKENIKPIGYGLNEILKMNPVWFDFIDEYKNYGEGRQNGNIAQEMAEIIPEAVFTTPSTGKMGINYDQMHAVYIKAIQELKAEIEELKIK